MLCIKEMKKIVFSLTFVLYAIVVLAMYSTQFEGDCTEAAAKPVEGMSDYGMIAKEVPEIMMPAAIEGLIGEYVSESYTAYPIGFYKEVKLDSKDNERMTEVIAELTGMSSAGVIKYKADFKAALNSEDVEKIKEMSVTEVSAELTYERFRELMRRADDIIGGGSRYGDDNIICYFSMVPKTYEEALTEYNEFMYEDKITNGYARLFCDYLGIVLAVIPVFVCAAYVGLDKRSDMEQLIYSKKISSIKLIGTRYAALCVCLMIPVFTVAALAHIHVTGLYPGYETDFFAMFKYTAIWLMPHIMFTVSAGMVLTEIFTPVISVFVQGTIWFMSLFTNSGPLIGSIGKYDLIIRHNSISGRSIFMENIDNFIYNRVFYIVLSLILTIFVTLIYDRKRKGKLYGIIRSVKNTDSKSEA